MKKQPTATYLQTRLSALLAGQDWTAYDAAAKSGLHVSIIYRILSGQTPDPSYSTLCRLADTLGVGVETFREKVWS